MASRVGLPSSLKFLEDQHGAIIQEVRDLKEADGDGESLTRQVREIRKMLREHAEQEENAMEVCDYPELDLHKKYHQTLLGTLDMILAFCDPPAMLEHREAIATCIEKRLSEEIRADQLFARFLKCHAASE